MADKHAPDEPRGFTVTDRRTVDREPAAPPPPRSESRAGSDEAHAAEAEAIDFGTFVMSLASSALIHLGELPGPEGAAHPSFTLAKQTIDILGMLEEKTRGNLSAEEARLLEHLVYDLRLKYVEAKRRAK